MKVSGQHIGLAVLLALAGLLAAMMIGMIGSIYSTGGLVDNDRRAMIAAREGNCAEAWRRYHNSQGNSGTVVSSFCPTPSTAPGVKTGDR